MALSNLLGEELQQVALELQEAVGANVGDEICLVWTSGARNVAAAGGAGVDRFGAPVSNNSGNTRPDQQQVLTGRYYCRIANTAQVAPTNWAGQLVNVQPWIVSINENQNPVIESGDVITRCVKREVSLEIANLGWQPETSYESGVLEMPANLANLISPVKRCYYRVKNAGVSGEIEPLWPTVKFAIIQDGSITWECMGPLQQFSVKDPGGKGTVPVSRIVGCVEIVR